MKPLWDTMSPSNGKYEKEMFGRIVNHYVET